jgi:hypothetical protein
LGQLSPYISGQIARFGVYATDVLRHRPKAFDPGLTEADSDILQAAA